MIRTMVSAAFLAVGCNMILGNEERDFVGTTSGSESGSGGMNSTTGSSGEGGRAGMSPESGGAAGAAGVGDGGEAGEAADSTGTDGVGGVGGASTASATSGSNTTGEPCECTVGLEESMQEPCGNCGTATRTKTCGEDCRWGEYGAPEACMNQGVCALNTPPEQVTGHCPNGGWRYDTRNCGVDCQWEPWIRGKCEYGENTCSGCACMSRCSPTARCLWIDIDCDEAAARAECVDDADFVCGTATFEFVEWLPN